MLIPSDKMDEYIKWYEWRKDKYRLKTNVRLSEKDNNWICDEIIYFDSFQAMKEYVHEKKLERMNGKEKCLILLNHVLYIMTI